MLLNRPLTSGGGTLVLGELGLLGEFRSVTQVAQRTTEAQRLGFTHAVVPARSKLGKTNGSMQHHLVKRIDQAIDLLS